MTFWVAWRQSAWPPGPVAGSRVSSWHLDSIRYAGMPEPLSSGLSRSASPAQYWRGRNNADRGRLMAKSELYEKGAAMRRQPMGQAEVERLGRTTYGDPVMQKFLDVATETVFGALWTRPGRDLKTRALICVISDTCTGREPELALHLRMALRQGWSEDELTEALLHLSGYIGVPIIRESMMVASKVFREYREERA